MTLAIGWPHDPGENGQVTRDPGPMTLAIGWPHDPGENVDPWPHVPGDRHSHPSIDLRRSNYRLIKTRRKFSCHV